MAAPGKPYGLIFPKKAQPKGLVKHAVFMDDSDEESSISESLQREALKKQAMKQTKMEIQRALAEDSTVYEYDGIYEDIQQKKAEGHASVLAGRAEKKPKYIQNILRAAELRKKEQEKRMEKKIQKERETEGGAFDDKEAFVTSAYKKKLQERAEEEERERKEAAVEACLDVTKQKDLSGFYRHLLNQAVGEEKMPHCSLRGPGIKGEDLSEKPPNSNQTHKSLEDKTRTRVPGKGEETLAADSDLQTVDVLAFCPAFQLQPCSSVPEDSIYRILWLPLGHFPLLFTTKWGWNRKFSFSAAPRGEGGCRQDTTMEVNHQQNKDSFLV